MSSDVKVVLKARITDMYQRITKKPLDDATADFYAQQVMEAKMDMKGLEALLANSPQKPVPQSLNELIPVVIEGNAILSEEAIIKLIMGSATYAEKIKPLLDVGQYVRDHVSGEFWRVFYETSQMHEMEAEEFAKLVVSYAALRELKGV